MRTNPFYDVYLFIIGSTPDHNALGNTPKFVMVVLFALLLAAGILIAFGNFLTSKDQRTPSNLTIAVCRFLIGSMWFQGCLWKLPLPVSNGLAEWTGNMKDGAAFEFHRLLVENVYLPYLYLIGPLVFLAELAFAISFMLGVGVRLIALLAIPYALHLWLGLYLMDGEWPWNYVFLAMVHVFFVVCAAGRSLGIDAIVHRHQHKGAIGRLIAVAS